MISEDQYIEEQWNKYIESVTESGMPLWICDQYRGNLLLEEQAIKESESAEWSEPGYMALLEKDSERISGNTSYPDIIL